MQRRWRFTSLSLCLFVRLDDCALAKFFYFKTVCCKHQILTGFWGFGVLWRGTGRQDWVACSPSVWVRSTAGDGAVLNGWPITLLQNRNSRQQRKCAAAQSARCVQPLLVPLVHAGPGSAEVRRTDTRQNVVSSNPVRGGRKH